MSPAAFVSKSPDGWTNCHSGKTRPLIVSEPQLCLWHSRHRNGCLEGYRICERQSLPRVPGYQRCQETNHHSCPFHSKHQQVHKQSLQLLDRHCNRYFWKARWSQTAVGHLRERPWPRSEFRPAASGQLPRLKNGVSLNITQLKHVCWTTCRLTRACGPVPAHALWDTLLLFYLSFNLLLWLTWVPGQKLSRRTSVKA